MKTRSYLIFVFAFLVLVTTGIWMFQTEEKPASIQEFMHVIIIILVVGFALVLAYRRFVAIKKGQPAEDEFSKKIMMKASSWSYFVSLYVWILVLYLINKEVAEAHTLVAGGILAMAVLIALFYLVIRFFGIRKD